MLPLYFLTLFISAALLFICELMFAKRVLPLLGGTPAVWNTCMVFYQAALLAGYACAHFSLSRLAARKQILLQIILLLLPLLLLPLQVSTLGKPPSESNPIPWLLLLLASSIGLPYFVLSTIAPTLQKWFSYTHHPAANDPYFLYSASNFGSLAGLLGYVTLIEPCLTLSQQSSAWSMAYLLLLMLCLVCAFTARRGTPNILPAANEPSPAPTPPITSRQRLRWIALAFVPSSLMLGVTSFLTSDVAAVPLLWVVPLTLYLLTFMLAFARRPLFPHALLIRAIPMLVILQFLLLLAGPTARWMVLLIDLLSFFVIALACHGTLARERPPLRHLTEYYLLLSLGGVLGGAFNALLAPLLFNSVLEYPLALILACALLPRRRPHTPAFVWLDLAAPLSLGLIALLVLRGLSLTPWNSPVVAVVILGAFAFLAIAMAHRPLRFALGLAAFLALIQQVQGMGNQIDYQGRSFFGTYRVSHDLQNQFVTLTHGTTVHGRQSLDPSRRSEPLTYFHRAGPIGQVFQALAARNDFRNVAIIGLGTGSIAAYAQTNQNFTFYEIDPAITRIASNPKYFNFLHDAESRQAHISIIHGDARLRIVEAPDHHFDLLILDAFSGDSIPVHLLTRQALDIYLSKLAPRGVIAIHISNHYLNLTPIVGALANSDHLACLVEEDLATPEALRIQGKTDSTWIILACAPEDIAPFAQDRRWRSIPVAAAGPLWTDDFSNIVGIIRWR